MKVHREEITAFLKSVMMENVGKLNLDGDILKEEIIKLANSSCIKIISEKYQEVY